MKRFFKLGALVLVLVALSGCSKKSEMEELQPITIESLSAVSGPAQPAVDIKSPEVEITSPAVSQASVTVKEALPLPPQGPYKPTGIEIQTALKNAGFYAANLDGKIGPKSKKAVEDFQKANGLKVDGKVGPKTWEVLSKYLNPLVEPVKR